MAVVPLLPHVKFGPNDHREDAHHLWDSFIDNHFSDTYILRIQNDWTQIQYVGVANEVNNIRVPYFTS